MKRLINITAALILLMMYSSGYTFGQITLDHTYNGWASVSNLAISGYKYHVLDTESKTLKLYNTDHSLWKTVNLSVPAGYTLLTSVYNVSENLFSLDGKVGFTYSYYQTTPSVQYETRVINENGTILLTIAGATYAYAYEVDGEAKLLAYITNYSTSTTTTKVYSLPGNFVTGVATNLTEGMYPFPNPSENYITIPYSREMIGQQGEIQIFDLSGNCIRSFSVDNSFNQLLIRTDDFPGGTYLYKIMNPTFETYSGKFVIR